MLAKKHDNKVPLDAKSGELGARPQKDMPASNSTWQALALRPIALQRKLVDNQSGDTYEQEVKDSKFDDDLASKIRDKLKKKYSGKAVEEMMEIEGQLVAAQVVTSSEDLDQIVLEIEMRWLLVETMRQVDKYFKAGRFKFPDRNTGYMISRSFWTPLSPALQSGGGTALAGEHGATRNIFRPDYQLLGIESTAAQAVDAIFAATMNNPIVLDCNAMMVAVQYRAMKEAFGSKKFNQMFPEDRQGLMIGPVSDPEQQTYPDYKSSKEEGTKNHPFLALGLYTETAYAPGSFTQEKAQKDLIKGDWVYFRNHESYKVYAPNGMWQGEHAMYVGNGKFMGAGMAKAAGEESNFTYDEVLDELQRQYDLVYESRKDKKNPKPKSTKAELPGIVARLVPKISALEKLPKVTK